MLVPCEYRMGSPIPDLAYNGTTSATAHRRLFVALGWMTSLGGHKFLYVDLLLPVIGDIGDAEQR